MIRAPPVATLLVAVAALVTAAASAAHADGAQPSPAPLVPKLLYYVAPIYPELNLTASREVRLSCALHISIEGKVEVVDCPSRVGERLFARSAEHAFEETLFVPLDKEQTASHPNGVDIELPSEFALQASPDEGKPNPILAGAELIQIQGELLEAGLRKPIAGADVIALGLSVFATTDALGKFQIALPPGAHQLIATRADFQPLVASFELKSDSDDNRSLTLHAFRRDVVPLEATVRAQEDRSKAPGESSVSHEELRNVPGAQNDPVRVVEDLPGVARAPYAGGQLIVRGAQPQDTGAFFDGQKIPILYHLLNGPSVLSEEMVERIDFLPGGAGVYFGRQLAGIVDVMPRTAEIDRLHGSLAIDLNKSSAFLRGPIGDTTSFAFGGRVSYVNPVYTITAKSDETYQVPLYWDYQARIDQKLPDQSRLSLTAFGSGDSFTQINPGRGTAVAYSDQKVHFHRFQLKWDKPISSDVTFTLSPQFGFGDDVTADSGQGPGAFSLPSEVADQSKQIGLRAQLSAKSSLGLTHFGVDASYERVNYQVDEQLALSLSGVQSGTNAEEIRANGTAHFANTGIFADHTFSIGNFKFTPGARLDIFHWTGSTYSMFDPRLWARYVINPSIDLFAYAGVYHQAPEASQLDPNIGNPGLTPERANQYGAGGNYHFGSDWSVRLEGFLQRRTSLPFNGVPSLTSNGSVSYPLLIGSGIARSVGMEIMIRRELTSQIYGWISYTLSRSQQLERPGFQWEPTDYDQPHVLTVLVAYRRETNAEISARLRVTSGNPIRAISGSVLDADSGNYLPYSAPFGSARLPPFVQLDFQVNNVWTSDYFKLSMYIELDNLLDRDNAEGIAYDYRFTQVAYIPGQPLNASVGAKVSF